MQRIDALRENIARLGQSDQAFAKSLLDQAHQRGLSEKQLAWVDKLVERATKPKAAPIDVREIVSFMTNAGIKRPQIILALGEQGIRLSIAGPGSRTPGHINVTSADRTYEDRKFFGRIGPDGRFDPSLSIEPDTQAAIVAALLAMASDPAGTAATYGKLMGECCFCRLPLSDDRSLAVGYGKICARRYGLPWSSHLVAA
jgi:hypothetical protein